MEYKNLIPLTNENIVRTMLTIKNTIKYEITVFTMVNVGALIIMLVI